MKSVRRSGKYRVQPMVNGKRYSLTFDHRPTQAEINAELQKRIDSVVTLQNAHRSSYMDCANKYIALKDNILSASTKRSYKSMLKNLPQDFSERPIGEIDQITLQQLINDLSVDHTPKTVKNYRTFITSVITTFIPTAVFNLTLPKPQKVEAYIPTKEDVERILADCNDKYYIIFSLAKYGMRRSEIMALDISDVHPNYVSINKALVQSDTNEWIIQPYNKTTASTREVPIDTGLYERIQAQGYVFKGHPDKIYEYLIHKQKKLNIPRFKLHAFRHYCATELYHAGFNSKDIMKVLGWSSDSVMKRIYTHARIDKDKEIQRKMVDVLK